MLESTQSEINQIPLVTLPMAFKQRLAQLAYIPDLKNLRKTCPEIKNLCRNGAREFEQLYLTDDDAHFQKAKFYMYVFRIFKHPYMFLRLIFNDLLSFRPTWHNRCTLQYVEKNRTKIYISDTAVLYCVNSDSYDKIIPYICGPYTRISIRGEVRWDQVKRLMHPNVREIQILAKMDLRPDEYDEFAEFMEQHLRGKPYK
uniref:F-box domain-containing protein n=1 Tax=Panagrellus redivivus TaxID=6233 RepID=A0A7E4WCB0_PANRE